MRQITLAALLMTDEESRQASFDRERRILTLKDFAKRPYAEMSEDEVFHRGKLVAELKQLRDDRRESA